MNYKKIAELAQEAITLEELHSDYMKGNIINEHNVNYIRERLHNIEEEIISTTWQKEKIKATVSLNPLDITDDIQNMKDMIKSFNLGINFGVVDKDGDMFTKDCKITIAPNFKGFLEHPIVDMNEYNSNILKLMDEAKNTPFNSNDIDHNANNIDVAYAPMIEFIENKE